MNLKNQDLALSDIKFNEMPEELAKQFSNVGGAASMTRTHEITPMQNDANSGFKADEIM